MARKFLYLVTIVIALVIAALFALRIWSQELTEIAMVPGAEFVEQPALGINAYEDPAMWFSRPEIDPESPARWRPDFAAEAVSGTEIVAPVASAGTTVVPANAAEPPPFAVFFVHPTSYLERANWNAPLDDRISQDRARLFVRGMASPFNKAAEIWAPRYRQATFGAFLTDKPEGNAAIDSAYRDVEQAFDAFVSNIDPEMPIVLAGHSQGALHVLKLLRERVAGTPLQDRIAMAYPIGWPISVAHDLPALPLPACVTPEQAACIVTWSSFAEPADPSLLLESFGESPGFDGEKRGNGPTLCVNPITGILNDEALAAENLGTLVPSADLTTGELVAGAVPARCGENGLLLIGGPPELGPHVLPGNNYHVYDIPLFWRNLQQDVARRVESWTSPRS